MMMTQRNPNSSLNKTAQAERMSLTEPSISSLGHKQGKMNSRPAGGAGGIRRS